MDCCSRLAPRRRTTARRCRRIRRRPRASCSYAGSDRTTGWRILYQAERRRTPASRSPISPQAGSIVPAWRLAPERSCLRPDPWEYATLSGRPTRPNQPPAVSAAWISQSTGCQARESTCRRTSPPVSRQADAWGRSPSRRTKEWGPGTRRR